MSEAGCVTSIDCLYTGLYRRVGECLADSDTELPGIAAVAGMTTQRLMAIRDGVAREVTLREIAGLSLAFGLAPEHLLGRDRSSVVAPQEIKQRRAANS